MPPSTMDAEAGMTAMDFNGAVTVRLAVPLTDPEAAVIVAVPAATPVAVPLALMVAMVVADDVQVTLDVMSFVVLSVYVPIAANCWVAPILIDGVAGEMVIDFRLGVMVRLADPVTPLEAAVMVVEPAATPVAKPPEATVATLVEEELQVAVAVRS